MNRVAWAYEWNVYVLAAPASDTECYFKIGITSNINTRPLDVQVGCPVKIMEVLYRGIGSELAARAVERDFHNAFSPYSTSGEWFRFNLQDPAHKRDFNATARSILDPILGAGWKWEKVSMKTLRREIADQRNAGWRLEREQHRAKWMAALLKGRQHPY